MKIKGIVLAVIFAMLLGLCACGNKESSEEGTKEEKQEIKIATTAIPAKVLEEAKEDFEKKGYTLDIELYDDVFTPNTATEEGSIDGNFYQYKSFLDYYNTEKGAHLVEVGRPYYDIPISIYSDKYDSLNDMPNGARIGIYSDASSKARCLKVLESEGLIKLDEKVDSPTVMDITENPKQIEFVELDSDAKLTASLPDLDYAVIYMQAMVLAKLDPSKNLIEPYGDDSYAILLVVKDENKDAEWIKDLDEALTTDKVKNYMETEFSGALKPLF